MTINRIPEAIDILEVVATSPFRLTPPALEKTLLINTRLKRKEIKALIKDLVDRGELIYTYEFGSTFLERSFNKPIRISNAVVIKPPGHQYQPKSEQTVLKIKPGAAFGDGRHPTTRLAVRGIEYLLKDYELIRSSSEHRRTVLDIGTGSGILILAAVKLGLHGGMGIDIDPCARAEARENIFINDLAHRIQISDQYLETVDRSYFLVTANLRLPTLKKISPIMRKVVCPHGFMVVSGVHSHETEGLIKKYASKGFEKLWMETELDWAGVVLKYLE